MQGFIASPRADWYAVDMSPSYPVTRLQLIRSSVDPHSKQSRDTAYLTLDLATLGITDVDGQALTLTRVQVPLNVEAGQVYEIGVNMSGGAMLIPWEGKQDGLLATPRIVIEAGGQVRREA